jgi:hypothetical protein
LLAVLKGENGQKKILMTADDKHIQILFDAICNRSLKHWSTQKSANATTFFHALHISDFFQHIDGCRLAHLPIDQMMWRSVEILVDFLGIALHAPANPTSNELR